MYMHVYTYILNTYTCMHIYKHKKMCNGGECKDAGVNMRWIIYVLEDLTVYKCAQHIV